MRLFARVGQPARILLEREPVRMQEREGRRRHITELNLHLVKIERAALYARRSSGFEPLQRDPERAERIGKMLAAKHSVRTGLPGPFSDQNAGL